MNDPVPYKVHDMLVPLIDEGTIPVTDALYLVRLSPERQIDLAQRIETITYKEYKAILAEAKRIH